MATLSIDEILAAEDQELVTVDVPEWGGSVNLAPLTSKQQDDLEMLWNDENRRKMVARESGVKAWAVARALRNSDGSPMFAAPNDGAQKLAGKSSRALQRLWKRLCEISGMMQDPEAVEGN